MVQAEAAPLPRKAGRLTLRPDPRGGGRRLRVGLAAEPVDRATSEASISTLLETVQILSFDFHPLMIRVIGDLAVVQYLVDLDTEDADGSRSSSSFRITHTWLEEEGRWRIVGGMSSATRSE